MFKSHDSERWEFRNYSKFCKKLLRRFNLFDLVLHPFDLHRCFVQSCAKSLVWANAILSLRLSDHFMSVAHVSTYLRINVEAARMPGMIKKNQWLPCCVNLGEKSGASSCCSGPPLAAKLGPPESTLWHLLQNFHALDVSCFLQLIQLFHIIPHNLHFANKSIGFGVHVCLSTDSEASAPRVSPVRPCGIVGAWDGGFWQSRLLLFWVST